MLNGIININKPAGYTSSDIVVICKGVLRSATGQKHKVGHLGTLDPLGTGVLPISVGKSTKLFDIMQTKRKVYRAGLKLNSTTDTLDSDGVITATSNINTKIDDIINVSKQFIGDIEQVPPQYSAISVNGQKAYDIARNGGQVELKARKISIYNLKVIKEISDNEYELLIECSSGTYIRSLMRDISISLGGVGYMSFIERIQAGNFLLSDSVSLDEFKENPLKYIVSLEKVLCDYPQFSLNETDFKKFSNGVNVSPANAPKGDFVLLNNDKIFSICAMKNGIMYSKVRLFDDN